MLDNPLKFVRDTYKLTRAPQSYQFVYVKEKENDYK